MGTALVGFFRNHGKQVQIGRRDDMAGFLPCFTDGAFEGGFADRRFKFPSDGAPCTEIGRLGAQQQQMFAAVIFHEYKHRDFVVERRWH